MAGVSVRLAESAPNLLEQMTVAEAVRVFLTARRGANLSRETLAIDARVLRDLAKFLDNPQLDQVTPDTLRKFLLLELNRTSPATGARYHTTLKAFCRFAFEEGLLTRNLMDTVRKPRFPQPIIQPLTQEQVEAMVNTCADNTFVDTRDRLVLLALVDTGIRASELTALTLDDVDTTTQTFAIHNSKGNKPRTVPYGKAVASALRTYLTRRGELDTDRLIVNSLGQPTTRYRIRLLVVKRAKQAGIEHPRLGPHLLRHTSAVSFLRNGGNPFVLQRLLGHSDLSMTRRYVQLADSDLSDQHARFSPADALNTHATGGRRRLR